MPSLGYVSIPTVLIFLKIIIPSLLSLGSCNQLYVMFVTTNQTIGVSSGMDRRYL